MQRHTSSQSDISTGSQFCPTIHLGVFFNFHYSQQPFKTFSTLLKLPTPPPTLVFSLSACAFASYLMGKIEITEREITQLPVMTLTDFHHKCIHPFLFAICLLQEVTLQPEFSSLPQVLYSPTSLSPLDARFLMATLPVSSLPPLSSCSCQLAFKHAHTENRETKVKTTKVLLLSSYFLFLAKLFQPVVSTSCLNFFTSFSYLSGITFV